MGHNGFKLINNIYNNNSYILDFVFVDHDLDTNLFLPISPLFQKSRFPDLKSDTSKSPKCGIEVQNTVQILICL